jgi:hypothetical protein
VLPPGASQQRKNRRRQRAGISGDGGGHAHIPEQLLALAAHPGGAPPVHFKDPFKSLLNVKDPFEIPVEWLGPY